MLQLKGSKAFIYAKTWLKCEHNTLSMKKQSKNRYYVVLFTEMQRIGKYTKVEKRLSVTLEW